jgi:hypothetical protein
LNVKSPLAGLSHIQHGGVWIPHKEKNLLSKEIRLFVCENQLEHQERLGR